MSEFFDVMWRPFLACVILTGIHSYLGLHVIERGIIFVDLALAQIAALGATIAVLFGYGLHSTESYILSLGSALVGAFLFSVVRPPHPKVSVEAIIGVIYAVSAAVAIMVLSRAAEGGEELKSLMVGHILYVGWPEIIKLLAVYSVVGIFHFIFRERFLLLSSDPSAFQNSGRSVAKWDFLFYASFAVVITSSVELAGVLLVFSFLVVPSICAVILFPTIRGRLLAGWSTGALVSTVGSAVSYHLDMPTGATIVAVFGVVFALVILFKQVGGYGGKVVKI